MGTYTFTSTGNNPNLGIFCYTTNNFSSVRRHPVFISYDTHYSTNCISATGSNNSYYTTGVGLIYELPSNVNRFMAVTSITLDFTLALHQGNIDNRPMFITVAGKAEPGTPFELGDINDTTTPDFTYVELVSEDAVPSSGSYQFDLTEFGIQPYGYILYVTYQPSTRYDVTSATITIVTDTSSHNKTYDIPLVISGYQTNTSSSSHTQDQTLSYYIRDDDGIRIGSSSSWEYGYGINMKLPDWLVNTNNQIYKNILLAINKQEFTNLNPTIKLYLTASASRDTKASFGVTKGSGSLEIWQIIGSNESLLPKLYDFGPTGDDIQYRSSTATLSNWAGSLIDSNISHTNEVPESFLANGLSAGGGMSGGKIVLLYIQSAVLELEIADLNTVRVVNSQETGLDTYKVYIVENNTLVPYRVAIVNNQGTLDFYS